LIPWDTNLFDLKHASSGSVLKLIYKHEIGSVRLSLVKKDQHSLLYNFEKHPIQLVMNNRENSFYISTEDSKNYFLVLHNNNLKLADFSIEVNEYDYNKSNFWGPGGGGFFISIFMLIAGIVLIFISYCLYKKYKQVKSLHLLGNNVSGLEDIKLSKL